VLIPESGAGYSRVTHPFATNPPEQAPASSFDLHVLSTPPAFVLSQDQTLHKCLIATPQVVGTSSATHNRNRLTDDKFETDRTNQTDSRTGLTCFVLFYIYSKGIRSESTARNGLTTTGFWHLTLCTLLSSQGSDAPGFYHNHNGSEASYQGHSKCYHPHSRAGQLV
jgi:hypothetical protein